MRFLFDKRETARWSRETQQQQQQRAARFPGGRETGSALVIAQKVRICSHHRNTSSWNSVWHRNERISNQRSLSFSLSLSFLFRVLIRFSALTFERSRELGRYYRAKETGAINLTVHRRVSTISGSRFARRTYRATYHARVYVHVHFAFLAVRSNAGTTIVTGTANGIIITCMACVIIISFFPFLQ